MGAVVDHLIEAASQHGRHPADGLQLRPNRPVVSLAEGPSRPADRAVGPEVPQRLLVGPDPALLSTIGLAPVAEGPRLAPRCPRAVRSPAKGARCRRRMMISRILRSRRSDRVLAIWSLACQCPPSNAACPTTMVRRCRGGELCAVDFPCRFTHTWGGGSPSGSRSRQREKTLTHDMRRDILPSLAGQESCLGERWGGRRPHVALAGGPTNSRRRACRPPASPRSLPAGPVVVTAFPFPTHPEPCSGRPARPARG
jgi:hypothetical protein